MDRLVAAIGPIAKAMNMTFDVQGSHAHVRDNVIRLETDGIVLEPAPLTPDAGGAFELVGGTIRHVFPGAIVVPSAMTAFTDTQCEFSRAVERGLTPKSTGTCRPISTASHRPQ